MAIGAGIRWRRSWLAGNGTAKKIAGAWPASLISAARGAFFTSAAQSRYHF
jgi:hypothetical protein